MKGGDWVDKTNKGWRWVKQTKEGGGGGGEDQEQEGVIHPLGLAGFWLSNFKC